VITKGDTFFFTF